MKNLLPILFLAFMSNISFAQSDDLPENTGDNFSLEGALALFKKSSSVEEFETLINNESSNVNNLDLNNDGQIDYVSVVDIQQNNAHILILSTYLSGTEKQDIATINIEKTGNDQATLQMIGDQDLYAENTIVEPFDTNETIINAKGPAGTTVEINQILVNVWLWPSVRFIYAPSYIVWRSPYRWAAYPRWFRPWRPFGYRNFYNRCAPNRIYYRRTPNYRVNYSRNFYAPRRSSSKLIVHNNRRGNTTVIRTNNNRGGRVNVNNNNRNPNRNNNRGGGRGRR